MSTISPIYPPHICWPNARRPERLDFHDFIRCSSAAAQGAEWHGVGVAAMDRFKLAIEIVDLPIKQCHSGKLTMPLILHVVTLR